MKKILSLLLSIFCILSFASCKTQTTKEEIDEYKNHKEILSLVSNYSYSGTNGFDYSLEQKINDTIVNAHTITLRLNDSNTIGCKIDYSKRLNDEILDSQYTTKTITSYYRDNKIGSYSNNELKWEDSTLNEFVSLKISSFSFDFSKLNNINLIANNDSITLAFTINDNDAKTFLNVVDDIENLSFEIKVDSSYSKMLSFKMNYNQSLTKIYYNFVPYNGNVNIEIPE